MRVGFIGLGKMGSGTAANLLKVGHEATGYNRTRAKAEPLVAQGARAAADIAAACRGDTVITMLADDTAVEAVTQGDAILDRLVHNAHRIEIKGESMRRKAAQRAITVGANQES
jgi:3-hydroxyisobutyrate dehydrogenase-like beta-hydroxyacid dehydrogenase